MKTTKYSLTYGTFSPGLTHIEPLFYHKSAHFCPMHMPVKNQNYECQILGSCVNVSVEWQECCALINVTWVPGWFLQCQIPPRWVLCVFVLLLNVTFVVQNILLFALWWTSIIMWWWCSLKLFTFSAFCKDDYWLRLCHAYIWMLTHIKNWWKMLEFLLYIMSSIHLGEISGMLFFLVSVHKTCIAVNIQTKSWRFVKNGAYAMHWYTFNFEIPTLM